MEIRASDTDIAHYLEYRLRSEKRLGQLLKNDTELKRSVIDQITGNAEGMFLLAQLQMDFISRKNNRRDIRRSLDNLPRQLSDVYEAAFERIAKQNTDDARLAERLLCWIIAAKRPLSRLEIQHALAVEPDDTDLVEEGIPDEEIILGACAGLVIIDAESSIVRMVHYTAQEYFENTFQPRLHRFGIEVATTCITYLSFEAVSASSLENGMNQQFTAHPLLRYVAQHWGHHAREALSISDANGEKDKYASEIEVLQTKILNFCNDQTKIQPCYRAMFRLEHDYDMEISSLAKVTGLHVASGPGLTRVVASLLNTETEETSKQHREISDVNAADSNGETPLHWAAEGHNSVVNLLLAPISGRISPDEANIKGRTPLRLAVENSHADVVRSLVARDDIQLDRADDVTEGTALWRAADVGDAKAVAALLSVLEGAGHSGRKQPPLDVNSKDTFYGETPLLRAVERGHVDVVRELLARGGPDLDLQATDQFYEETPLERARAKGYGEIVKLLEEVTEKEAGGL
ncbi:ankyrin repeat and SAM domain-containing protein 3 [Rhypophila decipiens]|uniref:Ankyrin repeat and SAM domain-containing protein 3 n=1 Tax=Rhypophila decipiens TaxID=261697 RepID=A0AAN6XZ16_9PEZI|nr:ankyrin repeat and SAM domain-containing protein 3 [Rhypophila decipiens]